MNSTKEVTHRIGAMPQELALAVPVTTRMVLNPEIEGRDDESDGWLLDRCIPVRNGRNDRRVRFHLASGLDP